MRIQQLYNQHPDRTIYIIGTGPSLRCLPMSFFENQITIGLNKAWKHLRTSYAITVHPELVLEWQQENKAKGLRGVSPQWIIKKKPPMADLSLDDPHHYVFGTDYSIKTITNRPKDTLYLGEGVQTTAMDMASRMGAKHIVLVGCDAGTIGGDFHAHDQHVKFLGMKPDDQFKLYRDTTAAVRAALRGFGVSVFSVSPFIGINAAEEDYARLTAELKLDKLPPPKDTSSYVRDPKTIRTGWE